MNIRLVSTQTIYGNNHKNLKHTSVVMQRPPHGAAAIRLVVVQFPSIYNKKKEKSVRMRKSDDV